MPDEPVELICTDASYNEVDCEDARAAWRMTREEAKAKGGKVSKAKPAPAEEKAEPEPPATKAVSAAPANKSK